MITLSPVPCITLFIIMRTSQLGKSMLVSINLTSSCPVTNIYVFSNRGLPSSSIEKLRVITSVCIGFRVSRTPLINNFREIIIYLAQKIWQHMASGMRIISCAGYKCLISLASCDMQIKFTLKCCLMIARMAKEKKTKDNKCCWWYGEQWTFLQCWLEYELLQSLWKSM